MVNKVKEIEQICTKYGFMDRKVSPYGFYEKVSELIDHWKVFTKDWDILSPDSKDIIRAEVEGFEKILNHWVEYENEPMVTVKMIEGKYAGKTMGYHKSLADTFIETGMAVAD